LAAVNEVEAFLATIDDPARRAEAQRLGALFREATGFSPKLWSGRIVGYGAYDYEYDSGHSGTSLATGFAVAPRQFSIYIMSGHAAFPEIMARLGKHRAGKSCIYVSRLGQIDEAALSDLIRAGLDELATRWSIRPN
jgi:hypothetical protein